jgi:DNA-directed RNA polymerase specialized sigma24 family protein
MAPRLYRFCLRLAGRKQDADDIFQDTFLRLHRARAISSGTRPCTGHLPSRVRYIWIA